MPISIIPGLNVNLLNLHRPDSGISSRIKRISYDQIVFKLIGSRYYLSPPESQMLKQKAEKQNNQ